MAMMSLICPDDLGCCAIFSMNEDVLSLKSRADTEQTSLNVSNGCMLSPTNGMSEAGTPFEGDLCVCCSGLRGAAHGMQGAAGKFSPSAVCWTVCSCRAVRSTKRSPHHTHLNWVSRECTL